MREASAMAQPWLLLPLFLLLTPHIVLANRLGAYSQRSSSALSSSSSSASASALSSSSSISSDSILVALLDSPYTELAELADEAALLQTLEDIVGSRSITILVPGNSFLDRDLDADFRKFLLEPGNIDSLRTLLRFHVVPEKITAAHWGNRSYHSLAYDALHFSASAGKLMVDLSNVIAPDAIERRDGIVHGIDRLLIPKSVQNAYNRWKEGKVMTRILAVQPEGAPTPETYLASKKAKELAKKKPTQESALLESVFHALAPGPALAPAPAPGPSTGRRYFDGESAVQDFISTIIRYGGYNEMADLLVNLTSLAPELAKLVSEGYRMTILAPNDEAMSKLKAEALAAPGAPEQIIFYHIIPEYQTEESFYNAVRRFGKVVYQTLRDPYKLSASEEDGTVVFGEEEKAHLIDIDIFKDGRISVQGIDKVLSPPEESSATAKRKLGEGEQEEIREKKVEKTRRKQGLVGVAYCWMLGRLGGVCN